MITHDPADEVPDDFNTPDPVDKILDNHAFNYYDIQARYQSGQLTDDELELQMKMLNAVNKAQLDAHYAKLYAPKEAEPELREVMHKILVAWQVTYPGEMLGEILTASSQHTARAVKEARIDQMAYVNQRMIGKNTGGDRVFYDKEAVIAENKLKDWQRNILKHMVDELEAQSPPKSKETE